MQLKYHRITLSLFLGLLLLSLAACGSESPAPLSNHFQGGGISFNYPSTWKEWEKQSLGRIRNMMKSQGADVLTMVKAPDGMAVIQLVKVKNPSPFEDFFRKKKEAADHVSKKGMEIQGKKFVKYEVTVVTLSNNLKAILGNAEDSIGEKAVSYQFLVNGYEYDFNFIYKNKRAFDKYDPVNRKVIETVKFQK